MPSVRRIDVGNLTVGGPAVPVVAGPYGAGDAAWLSLRRHHGRIDPGEALPAARARGPAALLVEPFSARDLPAVAAHADAAVVGAAWMQDFRLVRAVAATGLPVVVQRAPAATLEEWLAAAEYCRAEGNPRVLLCEPAGHRGGTAGPDLALLDRGRREGFPVLAELSATPRLAAAAVAAGADGVVLAEDAPADAVGEVRGAVAAVAPLVRPADVPAGLTGDVPAGLTGDVPADVPAGLTGDANDVLAGLTADRAAIDRIDAALAVLLDRRAAVAARIQRRKPVGGFAGRDVERERRIVAAMAARAPRLGPGRLARIMTAVIEAGLEAAEEEATGPAPAGASGRGDRAPDRAPAPVRAG